jgi:hypothetical protein
MFHKRFGYYRSFASFVDEEARLSTAARSVRARTHSSRGAACLQAAVP